MEQTPHGAQPLASPPVADGRIAHLRGRVTEGAEWAATTAWHPVVIARAAYERDRDIGGGLLAGAIAFRLFVWLAAFLVVIVSILGFIDAAGGDAAATLGDGGITAIAASEITQAASDAQRSRWLLLLAGLYALFSTSRTMVRALWTASAIAARRPVTKPPDDQGRPGLQRLDPGAGGHRQRRGPAPGCDAGSRPDHHPRLHRRLPRRHLARLCAGCPARTSRPESCSRAPSSSPWAWTPYTWCPRSTSPIASSERRRPTGRWARPSSCCSGSTSSAGSSSPGVSSTQPCAKSARNGTLRRRGHDRSTVPLRDPGLGPGHRPRVVRAGPEGGGPRLLDPDLRRPPRRPVRPRPRPHGGRVGDDHAASRHHGAGQRLPPPRPGGEGGGHAGRAQRRPPRVRPRRGLDDDRLRDRRHSARPARPTHRAAGRGPHGHQGSVRRRPRRPRGRALPGHRPGGDAQAGPAPPPPDRHRRRRSPGVGVWPPGRPTSWA